VLAGVDPAVWTPPALAALALTFSGPVPAAVGRWTALRRTPRAAMVLWQAIALAAVLAAVGAGVSLVTSLLLGQEGPGPVAGLLAALSAAVTLVVVARLLLSGHRVGIGLRALRRRHRALVDVLAERRGGVSVIEAEVPVAYCLPGLVGGRVVLSAAAYDRLGPDELAAVVAHERAHLRARHDLVLEAFGVLHRAFPCYVSSRRALAEVTLLVELLADASAIRRTGRAPLLRALVAMAGSRAPEAALGAGEQVLDRLRVLEHDGPTVPDRVRAATAYVLALGALVLPTVLVVRPWLLGIV